MKRHDTNGDNGHLEKSTMTREEVLTKRIEEETRYLIGALVEGLCARDRDQKAMVLMNVPGLIRSRLEAFTKEILEVCNGANGQVRGPGRGGYLPPLHGQGKKAAGI